MCEEDIQVMTYRVDLNEGYFWRLEDKMGRLHGYKGKNSGVIDLKRRHISEKESTVRTWGVYVEMWAVAAKDDSNVEVWEAGKRVVP